MNSIAELETAVNSGEETRTVLVTANGKTKPIELRPEDDIFWRQECADGWYFEVNRASEVSHYQVPR